ncbi:hypothetical protein CDAR_7971 [Caerostris darwini]|uniref:Uncharacterized protein n=1 Tax=Caerostris darwini TaxID=1538125 RepID=A0AAV4V297_9ARAC|nr:hypothetical protein CDAR_7971 [Caerostris darwini]
MEFPFFLRTNPEARSCRHKSMKLQLQLICTAIKKYDNQPFVQRLANQEHSFRHSFAKRAWMAIKLILAAGKTNNPLRGQMPNDLEFILCASISTTNYGTVLLLKGVGVRVWTTEQKAGFLSTRLVNFELPALPALNLQEDLTEIRYL